MSVYIFTGRFQPVHNGHVSFIENFIDNYPNDKFILAIIRDCLKSELASDFDIIGNTNFQNEKNPFSSSQVLEMISTVFHSRLPGKVLTTLLPRPSDLIWQVIDSLFFNEERIWIFPSPEDPEQRKWEDQKAKFYESKGEKIIRIPVSKSVSSTEIRDCIDKKDYEELACKLPVEIIPLIRKYETHL